MLSRASVLVDSIPAKRHVREASVPQRERFCYSMASCQNRTYCARTSFSAGLMNGRASIVLPSLTPPYSSTEGTGLPAVRLKFDSNAGPTTTEFVLGSKAKNRNFLMYPTRTRGGSPGFDGAQGRGTGVAVRFGSYIQRRSAGISPRNLRRAFRSLRRATVRTSAPPRVRARCLALATPAKMRARPAES